MTTEPSLTEQARQVCGALGRAVHGDRWDAIQAANRAAIEAAQRAEAAAEARQASIDRFNNIAARIAVVIVLVALFVVLSAASLAAWRWVL